MNWLQWLEGLSVNPEHCWLVAQSLLHASWQCILIWLLYRTIGGLPLGWSTSTRFKFAFTALLLMGLTPFANAIFLRNRAEAPEPIQRATTAYLATGELRLFSVAKLVPNRMNADSASPKPAGGDADEFPLSITLNGLSEEATNASLHPDRTAEFASISVASRLPDSGPSPESLVDSAIHWRVLLVVLVSLTYVLGLLFMMVKLGLGISWQWRISLLHRTRKNDSLPSSLKRLAQVASRKLGRNLSVRVAVFQGRGSALVVGLIKPTILLNTSLLSGLTPTQIEQVLLHELAHVYRCDPLTQLAQRLIESLLFFHPLAWRLSREISQLREVCCDDIVSCTHCPQDYAQTLLACAEVSSGLAKTSTRSSMTLAATGTSTSQLRARIVWLLDEQKQTHHRFDVGHCFSLERRIIAGFAVLLLVIAAAQPWRATPPILDPSPVFQLETEKELSWRWVHVDPSEIEPASLLLGGKLLPLKEQIPEDVQIDVEVQRTECSYAQWQFGDYSSTSVAILVEKDDREIKRIFLDRNRDRKLSDGESLGAATFGRSWIAELDVEVNDAKNRTIHAKRQIAITPNRGNTKLRISTLGYASGIIQLGDRSVAVRRYDNDGNGVPTEIRDQVEFDLNQDGNFNALSERFAVRPELQISGLRYSVFSDRLGQTTRLAQNDEQGEIQFLLKLDDPNAQLQSLEGSLRDENGMVIALSANDLNVTMPVGHYVIEHLVLSINDSAGTNWRMTLAGDDNQSWFQVQSDQRRKLQLLRGFEFRITPASAKSSLDGSYSLEPSVRSDSGLVVTNFTCDDPEICGGWGDSVRAKFDFEPSPSFLLPRGQACTSGFG